MDSHSPFHEGERKVQLRAGEAEIGARNGSVISDQIIPGAIPFIAEQSMVVVSSLDKSGNVWASVIIGLPGFIKATSSNQIEIDTSIIISHTDDPFWSNIKSNPQIGLLIIELSTRRRLRVNGKITALDEFRFHVAVEQSYPNCPKYIQKRSLSFDATIDRLQLPKTTSGKQLTQAQINLIANADSFFVGSASPLKDLHALELNTLDQKIASGQDKPVEPITHGADASHRGGYPGFIQVKNQIIRVPDYKGNSMFNTLGNIEIYPQAGFVFIDFENKKLLQVVGSAKILWNQEDPAGKTNGTQRFWDLQVEHWQETPLPQEINWQFFDYSPHNPREKKIDTKADHNLILEVSQVINKNDRVKQFRLVSQDHSILPAFEPGAHLPITLTLENGEKLERHYSILSSSDDNRFYDIAVQREFSGRGGSNHIHEHFKVGSLISSKRPKNDFPLAHDHCSTILIAGGIGITPILSMVRELKTRNRLFELHYVAKSYADMAFYEEVKKLAGANTYLYFSREANSPKMDLQAIMQSATEETHLYVCGPNRMITSIKQIAKELNWKPERIHYESFGASNQNNQSFKIQLAKSNSAITVSAKDSILDVLKQQKINIAYDCERGECGMCTVRVLQGEVEHRDLYLNKEEQQNQMCVCVSRSKGETLVLDL